MTPIPHTRTGLGLVELLISLAITAMLLTSVAVAFHAALENVNENQDIAAATQAGRLVLHRMIDEVRRSVDVSTTSTSVAILPPDDGSGVQMTQYFLENGVLYYSRTVGGTPQRYAILGDGDEVVINTFWVTRRTGTDSDGNACTKSISARLDLQVGDNRQAITASTNIRRNMEW